MSSEADPPRQGPEPELKPRRVRPRIIAAPKHGQIYWCDFWLDAQLTEMWLHGPCLVVPTTTEPQGNNPWAWELSVSIDGQRSWVVCNHLYTIAPSRLSTVRERIFRVPNAEFNEILERVTTWLPRPFAP